MWGETLVFTVHMPEIALVRFLVWDHDPIGRDFIGQRTLAFSSMMPGREEAQAGGGSALASIPHGVPQELLTSREHRIGTRPPLLISRRLSGPTQGLKTFEESMSWKGEKRWELG